MSVVARALAYPYERPAERDGSGPPPDADGRTALLAIGANASPQALAAKLGDERDVPSAHAWLAGFDVVYSAHFAPYGAIPATPQHSPGTEVDVRMLWVTDRELEALHPTEGNYRFGRLEGIELRLSDGTRLDATHAYLSRHGCMRLDGEEVSLAAVPARRRRLPALDQRAALERARSLLAPDRDLAAFVSEHVDDAELRARRSARLAAGASRLRWPAFAEESAPC